MLIDCPECKLQVSDKALTCPHCGYPLKKSSNRFKRNKFRRLPNGFGQISEIKNQNLRNPYRAMVNAGFDSDGKPISKLLKPRAYFASYKEAYDALAEYNRNPYDLETDITMEELYEKWSKEHFEILSSDSSIRSIRSAWSYCKNIYKMRVKEVRARHLKDCIENGSGKKPTANLSSRIKSVLNIMLDYAVEYEIVDRNYARTFNTSSKVANEIESERKEHISFTDDEISIIVNSVGSVPYADLILIQCFMGWRPQELGLIKTENVDLSKNIIVGGVKTDNGIDREVPIHSFIRPLIEEKYKEAVRCGREYLFVCEENGSKLTYDKYQQRFKKAVKELRINEEHRPHDPRKQFVSMAKKYSMDEYAIKRIVGHAVSDITEKLYTDREEGWLNNEIEKIKRPVNHQPFLQQQVVYKIIQQ